MVHEKDTGQNTNNLLEIFGSFLSDVLISSKLIKHKIGKADIVNIVTYIFFDSDIDEKEQMKIEEMKSQEPEKDIILLKDDITEEGRKKRIKRVDRTFKDRVVKWYERNSIPQNELKRFLVKTYAFNARKEECYDLYDILYSFEFF